MHKRGRALLLALALSFTLALPAAAAQFQRINLACPTAVMQAALDRLYAALERRGG